MPMKRIKPTPATSDLTTPNALKLDISCPRSKPMAISHLNDNGHGLGCIKLDHVLAKVIAEPATDETARCCATPAARKGAHNDTAYHSSAGASVLVPRKPATH